MDLKVSYPHKRDQIMLLNYNALGNVSNFKGDQIMFLNYIRPFFFFFILMGSQKQNVTCPIICYPKKKKKKNQKWLQRWVKKLFKP